MWLVLPTFLVLALACGVGERKDTGDDDTGAPASVDPSLDLLIVLDSSDSMGDVVWGLVSDLDGLTDRLEDAGVTDWRIGVTTTSVNTHAGESSGLDEGEEGTLLGGEWTSDPDEVRELLLCHGPAWLSWDLPSDPAYVCGDPAPSILTAEYLDCACPDGWPGEPGSGTEEGLEAALLAICRASADPNPDCFSDVLDSGDAESSPAVRPAPGTRIHPRG